VYSPNTVFHIIVYPPCVLTAFFGNPALASSLSLFPKENF